MNIEKTSRVIIENVKPEIDHGKFPIKRVTGENVQVTADVYCDGHDVIRTELLYRAEKEKSWQPLPMKLRINDEWQGKFRVHTPGNYFYTVRAWIDHFQTWHRDAIKRLEAGTMENIDFLTGAAIIKNILGSHEKIHDYDRGFLNQMVTLLTSDKDMEEKSGSVTNGELSTVMLNYPLRRSVTRYEKELKITVDRKKAGFSAWYEMFPRSTSNKTGKHGNFKDVEAKLPYLAEMGFDILYLPPIHPIGFTNRKGKNNNVKSEKGEPGSPWAIGSEAGGHKSIHPELGSFDDFRSLCKKAAEMDIDIALDIAFQCSPDHPYVKKNTEWFRLRPDNSIQYAENPPKKYEDIYPFDFETEKPDELWEELKDIFMFWIEQGVKIFRVDNPHTKSISFWGWVIDEIKKSHPEIIFLSEAFTRPKVMYQLAKQGFSQSYTYFTWRNTKWEITTYCKELIQTDKIEFFRPNFWPNTPDILPEFLQITQRPGYLIRLILAATLSSNYGIYGPAFELMENTPKEPGSEEYLNSEKYEIKHWDWDSRKNLNKTIGLINNIRKENPALQNTRSLRFHETDNENLICYSKHTDSFDNIILVVVNLDPNHTHSGWMNFPVSLFDIDPDTSFQVHDLIAGSFYLWHGEYNYVEINPGIMPAHIFKIRRKVRSERDFDYFM